MNSLGIDPGLKNIGYGIVDRDGLYLEAGVFSMDKTIREIVTITDKLMHVGYKHKISTVSLERFVAYKGAHSSSSEYINLLIGSIIYAFTVAEKKINFYRAIDWKPTLSKHLYKTRKFDNPSKSFDKVFSTAAASLITTRAITNDHEADALCLAYMGIITEYANQSKTVD